MTESKFGNEEARTRINAFGREEMPLEGRKDSQKVANSRWSKVGKIGKSIEDIEIMRGEMQSGRGFRKKRSTRAKRLRSKRCSLMPVETPK